VPQYNLKVNLNQAFEKQLNQTTVQ